jgi:hypothetical protein
VNKNNCLQIRRFSAHKHLQFKPNFVSRLHLQYGDKKLIQPECTKFTSQLNRDKIYTSQELQAESSNQGICTLARERVWKQGALESNDISLGLHQVVRGSASTMATTALGVGFGKAAGILSTAAALPSQHPESWTAYDEGFNKNALVAGPRGLFAMPYPDAHDTEYPLGCPLEPPPGPHPHRCCYYLACCS